jgi:hypothetical protein
MPRHPPCALHSLSHKHNTTTTTTKTRTNTHTHPPLQKEPGRMLTGISARCSRPLCRSQTTNPPTPATTHTRAAPAKEARRLNTLPPDTIRRHRKPGTRGPDPSGPNSVPTPTPTPATPGSTPPQTPRSCTGSTEGQPDPGRVLHRRFH